MCLCLKMIKRVITRIMAVIEPIDIGFLKICCISIGVLLGGLLPCLTKGSKKLFWFAIFGLTLIPLSRMMIDAVRKEIE